jgi:long-chain fatty acid transport protein
MVPSLRLRWHAAITAILVLGSTTPTQAQFGTAIATTGPINASMGGASTAAPIDAAGALFWNPAGISGLDHSEIGFGAAVLIPRTTITSRVVANSLGGGFPAHNSVGTTGANNGVFTIPSFGLVYKTDESPVTYGFGLFTLGGFGVNYPVSKSNFVLNPRFPNGFGLGPLYSHYDVLQLAPTIAWAPTAEWSLGFQPNLDIANLAFDPAAFSAPALIQGPNGIMGPVYGDATHTRSRVGGGFQLGVYYAPIESVWSFGASFRSPQWFENFTYPSVTPQGMPARAKLNFDFPFIASVGTAFRGIDRLLVALDLRYVGYRETNGYRHTGFDSSGALRGLGFQDIFALALGAQYQVTDRFTVRSGYTFNLNPIGNAVTIYNVASPLNVQHSLALGFSYDVTKALKLSATYQHFFQNTNHGPITEPFIGPLHGSDVRIASTADAIVFGANVSF